MTLDEAIKHARHVAEAVCADCAKDHLQLADMKWNMTNMIIARTVDKE